MKDSEILSIMGEAFDDFTVADIGKSVVDASEFFGSDLIGLQDGVLREDVGNDFFRPLGRRREGCKEEREKEAEQNVVVLHE